MRVHLILFVLCGLALNASAQLNSEADDYACAFRTTPDGSTELWFTSSRISGEGRSRSMYVSTCSEDGFGEPRLAELLFIQKSEKQFDVTLDGTPSFSVCNGNFGVFASNRLVGGKYFGNDLYEMHFVNGSWNVRRIDELASEFWDDSPALSPDGNRLYFVSDRRAPGTRKADIYMSQRQGNRWSEPRALDDINTSAFSEETPFVSEDGELYYSTNNSGDFDIWRVKLGGNGLPSSPQRRMPEGMNQKGTDEIHPCFSPGGSFLLYSTNAGLESTKKDLDLRWAKVLHDDVKLEFDVRKRRRQYTERYAANIRFQTGSFEKVLQSQKDQPMMLVPNDFLPEPKGPAQDTRFFTTIVRAESDSAQYISAVDTLVGSRSCSNYLSHTLFVWDTSTYFEPSCIDTFPIKKVQYFVTGYWCPTTNRFKGFADCPSLFVESDCITAPCQTNDVYSFKVEKQPRHPECIAYGEFAKQGSEFAELVDDAIEQHLKAMQSTFGSACVRRAIMQRKPISVVVEGFTDPRGYGSDCHYFGPTIDFSKSAVQVDPDIRSHFRNDEAMKKYGSGGNQLLSELRAYNLAVLLDNIWTDRIPEYRKLKEEKLINVLAVGRAIDQRNSSFEQRRSAEVRVDATTDEVIIRSQVPKPGSRVVLCDSCK